MVSGADGGIDCDVMHRRVRGGRFPLRADCAAFAREEKKYDAGAQYIVTGADAWDARPIHRTGRSS